jgi:hypothetical protein
MVLNLENNQKNAEFFRRYVIGARFNRGKNIPNRNIINFSFDNEPKIKIIADIQGSGNSRYVINIIEDQNGFKIIHDCPDFKKGTKFCKHIVKILLLIDNNTCRSIFQNYNAISFSSNFSLVKESKTQSYLLKAEELMQQSKYYEAINFLENAYEESKNFNYIKKASHIAFKHKFYEQIIRFSVKFKELIDSYRSDYSKIIGSALSTVNKQSFSKTVELIINIQDLLEYFPSKVTVNILNESNIRHINNPILRYLLLHKLDALIHIEDYFRELSIDSFSNLKNSIEQETLNLVNETILNMEPEEEVDSFITLANKCKFNNYNSILSKVQEYKKKLKDMYLEALKLKHAYLRSLVIANTKTDKLKNMKFIEKYNYPSLIWTTPLRNEKPIHYYLLEKCGFERHHLEYINKKDFIENYPVFKTIFSGNNPLRHGIKDFWEKDEPKIINTVQNERITELDFEVNFKDLTNFLLIEWDLAQSPILGSYICQFKDGFLIPDKNHPLTHEVQPFDLILCDNRPIAIKGNNVKIYRPIRRINIKTAIELVWGGINYITSYLPLDLIHNLKSFNIDEFDAFTKIDNVFRTSFLPNKEISQRIFQDFIRKKVLTELNNTYLKIVSKPKSQQKILNMIGFERYSGVFKSRTALQPFKNDNLKRESLQELKLDLKKYVSEKLTEIIKKKELNLINIKVLRTIPTFRKWTAKIIYELKKQLENSLIYKVDKDKFNIKNLFNNYYGRIIVNDIVEEKLKDKISRKEVDPVISEKDLVKIMDNFKFLKLNKPKITKKIA